MMVVTSSEKIIQHKSSEICLAIEIHVTIAVSIKLQVIQQEIISCKRSLATPQSYLMITWVILDLALSAVIIVAASVITASSSAAIIISTFVIITSASSSIIIIVLKESDLDQAK